VLEDLLDGISELRSDTVSRDEGDLARERESRKERTKRASEVEVELKLGFVRGAGDEVARERKCSRCELLHTLWNPGLSQEEERGEQDDEGGRRPSSRTRTLSGATRAARRVFSHPGNHRRGGVRPGYGRLK